MEQCIYSVDKSCAVNGVWCVNKATCTAMYNNGKRDATMETVKAVIKCAKELPPCKMLSGMESYTDYNKGWEDAINYISMAFDIE